MISAYEFVAGALSLDFVNSVGGHRGGVHHDSLATYKDLLDWAVLGGALSATERNMLAVQAQQPAAARVLRRAKRYREALHETFQSMLAQQPLRPPVLELVNDEIAHARRHLRLARRGKLFDWEWSKAGPALDRPLWPIARDAGLLLTSPAVESLRECASETCGWLFLDQTKNRSRRWCDMKACGNREKLRRYRRANAS